MEKLVVVVGQGYVGLPLAMRAVESGYRVVGFDNDPSRVAQLGTGSSFVEDISDSELQMALSSGRYRPTTDISSAEGFDFAIITVPTPLHQSAPDLTYIETAAREVGLILTKGSTVILESTTYPGTTEEIVAPILQASTNLEPGVDFFLGYSPERIDPGNPKWRLTNTPKIVSGVNPLSTNVIETFYQTIVNTVVRVNSCKVAELAKLLENTFRHVNIALVNELAIFANMLGIDVWEAIDAASTKPFGYMRFTPGPGVGGHCLPIDPVYLSWKVRESLGHQFRFVELANDVNEHMPDYTVARVVQALNRFRIACNGSRILLIGLSYKPNSSDARESPAIRVAQLLSELKASISAVEPFVKRLPGGLDFLRIVDPEKINYDDYDLVVILTDHDSIDYEKLAHSSKFVLDTRHRLVAAPNVEYL